MECADCGATEGPFATSGRYKTGAQAGARCMNCQRSFWRAKHARRMSDPVAAERRKQNLAEYWLTKNPRRRPKPGR